MYLDLALRLWYILRRKDGRGWMQLERVYELSGGSNRQTDRWLDTGDGTFWHRAGDRLYLHGLGRVCKELNVKPKKPPVVITLPDVGDLAKYRAMLFASYLAGTPKTVSQSLLGEIFGRKERTIYEWCKLAKVNVQKNIVWSRLPGDEARKVHPVGVMAALGMKVPEEETATPGKVTHWIECWKDYPYKAGWQYEKGRRPALVRQFVNTYSVEMKREPKTRLQRRAARGVKGAKAPQALGNNPARAPVKGRVLYPRFPFIEDKQVYQVRLQKRRQSIDKSLRQNGFAYVQGQAQHHGAVTWEFVTLA